MTHRVVFAPEARADLFEIYDFVALHGGAERAWGYVGQIETLCRGLARFPQRGTQRDDIRAGLRVIGFGRRVSIAFHIHDAMVTIDRVLYGGRDLGALLDDGGS